MMLLIIEGILIGCLLGLTGAGGGILAVPALMTTQQWTVAQAAPVALLAVTISAFIASIQGLVKKIVRYKAALWIALVATPMSHLGVLLANQISPHVLTILFSLVMFVVAYRLFTQTNPDTYHPPCRVSPDTGKFIWTIKTAAFLAGVGMIAGLLTGLLGVGGGFIMVPALKKLTNLNLHSIVATSLMIIFLVGSISISMHVLQGFHYPVDTTLIFIAACVVGMLIGRQLIHHISERLVQKIFASTVVCVALYLMLKALRLS